MENSSFDSVVVDDGIIDQILGFLDPKSVLSAASVNKRWRKVALTAPQHSPLPSCLVPVLKGLWDGHTMSRFKSYCALCVFNFLADPYFLEDNPRFPIDVFMECPWANTIMGGSSKRYWINPANELPGRGHLLGGKLGDVGALMSVQPPWSSGFRSVSNSSHRVLCSMAKNLVEWTQLVDLQKLLCKRGFDDAGTAAIMDACPPLCLSVFAAMRCASTTSIEIALHGNQQVLPVYNISSLDAFTRGAIHAEVFDISDMVLDTWVQHRFVIHGYSKGVRNITVSLRTKKGEGDTTISDGCLFGSPSLVILSDQLKANQPDG